MKHLCDDCGHEWTDEHKKYDSQCPACESYLLDGIGQLKIKLPKEEVDRLFNELLEEKDGTQKS